MSEKIKQFILDLEASGLPRNSFGPVMSVDGKYVPMDINTVIRNYGHLDIYQFGLGKEIHKRPIEISHTSIVPPSRRMYGHRVGATVTSYENVNGIKIPVKQYITQTTEREELVDFLSKTGKLKENQVRGYVKSVGEVMARKSLMTNIEAELDGRTINSSKWAFMNLVHTGEYRLGGTSRVEEKVNSKEFRDLGGKYKGRIPFQDFNGKGPNSLYEEVNGILSYASKDNPVQLGAWNPGYDIEVIRAVLYRNGEKELLGRFERAIADGTIELRAIEHEWQQIAYRLVKENPEMRSAFKIRWSPTAFRETGGRSGMIANTFEEFLYSTNKWSAQHVANVFSFTKQIQEAIPSGVEEHIASMDVKLTSATREVFDELLHYVNQELRANNKVPLRSISEISRLKIGTKIGDQAKHNLEDGKILTRALNKLVESHSATNANMESVESVLKAMKEPAARIADFEQRQFGSLYANAVNKVNHVSTLIKYGAPIAVGVATLLATYGIGGDERSGSILDRIPKIGNLMNKITNRQARHGRVNDSAEKRSHILDTMAKMIGVPLAASWAVGYVTASQKPKLFGVTRSINTVEDALNSFFRTALYGAKRIEKAFPMAKIARVTDMTEYLLGDRAYGQRPDGTWKSKRWDTITTDSKGKFAGKTRVVNRFEHGVAYEDLLDAAKVTVSEEQYNALRELFSPKRNDNNAARRIVKVSVDHKGRAVVFGEELDPLGNIMKTNYFSELWTKGITVDAKVSIHEIRHADIFGVGKWAKRDVRSNAIAFYKMQRDLVERNYMNKNTFEEMLKVKGIDAPPGTLRYWEEMLKYRLDIGAKGVGESRNELMKDGAYLAQKTGTLLNVKSLTGKQRWSINNIKAMTKFISPIIQNYTIEGMNNFLERPFATADIMDVKNMEKVAKRLKASDSIVSQFSGKALSFLAAPHLGLPMYNINGGMLGYLGQFTTKRVLPAIAGFEALRFTDHVLGALTGDPNGRGPLINIPIKAYQNLSLMYSKLSDLTGMTALAKKQESIAPGSTGLGIFANAASLASTAYVASKVVKMLPDAKQNAIKEIATSILARGGQENLMLRGMNKGVFASRTPMQKFASWAIANPAKAVFATMLIPSIPFLPGFIGSNKTYAERKAEFKGKKEVAIRKNRGWLLSTSPFQGGKISHFREHATSLIQKDWENRGVIWPSYWKRLAHGLTGGLYGRYMLEDYHKDSQPVYQSAPYAANIPIIGPLISSTVGKFIKPTIDYHKYGLEHGSNGMVLGAITGSSSKTLKAFGTKGAFNKNSINASQLTTDELARSIGLTSENSGFSLANKFSRSLHDFIGFRGFGYESLKSAVTGLKTPDEFTPYAQSASEFYNSSQEMWNYSAGDVTLIGGEFLRRIFQYPDKRWFVNQIPNEFKGVSWIPQGGKETGKASSKDLTVGTTFNKVPMGWLHATRKGWEMQFPEVKGLDMEAYPDPIRLEILKHMSPHSGQFSATANKVKELAIGNKLTPEQEQRYYDTLQQVGQLKDQLYAYEEEASYNVSTTNVEGRIQDVDGAGRFTLDTMPGRTFRLSGVSLDEQDIRARLLKERQFKDQFELSDAMKSVVSDTRKLMDNNLSVGRKVSFDVASMDQMINPNQDVEAIMGGLNTSLIDKGAGFVNTGNLSKYNIFQKINGFPSRVIGKYWDKMTAGESFWINKLKPQRDYLSHYKYSNVFNRDVKLWNHPIEQIFKPMIASTLHKFGATMIPKFTIARRRNQEYWDVLKYIKGKVLENKTGNPLYRDMWKSTMLGADPIRGNHEQLLAAMPENEKAFFSRFANEPSAKKRGEILKYIPAAQRRIFISLWAKQRHAANIKNDANEEAFWSNIKETEGFGMTAAEEKRYRQETDGSVSKADWKRLKYIEEYSKHNYIPGIDSDIWREDVDIDNVELLSLKGDGENVEDYGFFEDKVRMAAFDSRANLVAMQLKSQVLNMSSSVGTIAPYIASNYNAQKANSSPSMTLNPLAQHQIQTNGYERLLKKNYSRYVAEIADDIVMVALRR